MKNDPGGIAIPILGQTPQSLMMSFLQQAERELLAGRVGQVIVVTVDTHGMLQLRSAIQSKAELMGVLEMAKLAVVGTQPLAPPTN